MMAKLKSKLLLSQTAVGDQNQQISDERQAQEKFNLDDNMNNEDATPMSDIKKTSDSAATTDTSQQQHKLTSTVSVHGQQQQSKRKTPVVSDNKQTNNNQKKRKHLAWRLFFYPSSSASSSRSSPSAPSPSSTSVQAPPPDTANLASTSTSHSIATTSPREQSTPPASVDPSSVTASFPASTSKIPSSATTASSQIENQSTAKTRIKTATTTSKRGGFFARRDKTNKQATSNKSSSNKSSRLFASSRPSTKTEITSTSSTTNAMNPSSTSNAKQNKPPHIITNSNNKQVISIPLPPYELEVSEVLDGLPYIECPLCVLLVDYNSTPDLQTCSHRTCLECMQRYLQTEINHSRLRITCPICSEPLQQQVIREILNDDKFYFKYESFMLRKVLAAEPDARWCPAPDCGYAVLATGCASCPRLVCQRDGCKTEFCYHCKQEWHPNQTCSAASIQRNKRNGLLMNAFNISDLISSADETDSNSTSEHEGDLAANNNGESTTHKAHRSKSRYDATRRKTARKSSSLPVTVVANSSSLRPEDIKECPVCSSRIIKMNDGSCNHMTCSICETNFCWLCMKEISDLHYFSPSGCTFWGKKPWSRKKKLLWRLGMLVGAPICIVFIAGIAVPAIVIGIPVWAARKLHTRLEKKQFSRYRKNAIITCGVLLSFVVSPIISAMALAVGIPILLGYVYGVVPLSLCRSSGGCLSSNPSVENLNELNHQQLQQQSAIVTSSSSASSSVVNQARNQLQRLQIQKAQQEYKRQQAKSEQHQLQLQQKSPFSTLTSSKATSSGSQATSLQYGNSASVDTATGVIEEYGKSIEVRSNHSNHGNAVTTGDGDGVCNNAGISVGGGSIGEPSLYTSNISLETTSIGNVTNIVERCSRNSTSGGVGCNLSSAGYGEDLETASNKALSGSILSHKIAEDAHSTKALAGSIISKESGGYTLIPVDVPESARATVSSLQTVANEQQIATT